MTSLALIGISSWAAGPARANDRELTAVLDRLACVPTHVSRAEPSPIIVLYQVTRKRSGRVLEIACSEVACHLQPRSREDEEK